MIVQMASIERPADCRDIHPPGQTITESQALCLELPDLRFAEVLAIAVFGFHPVRVKEKDFYPFPEFFLQQPGDPHNGGCEPASRPAAPGQGQCNRVRYRQ